MMVIFVQLSALHKRVEMINIIKWRLLIIIGNVRHIVTP